MQFSKIEDILGYTFKDKKLLQTAFTHSSYANEHNTKNNERLEFLGDAILEFVITDKLFKLFDLSEGELTKYRASLVSEPTLSFIIEQLKLDAFILKGKGESHNVVDSKSIKCDLFEAIVGAMYLDGGITKAKTFIVSVLGEQIEKLKSDGLTEDPKSRLQERLKNQKIVYSTTKHGESHNPHFKCSVIINGVIAGYGEGTNKKSAEKQAAKNTLSKLKKV